MKKPWKQELEQRLSFKKCDPTGVEDSSKTGPGYKNFIPMGSTLSLCHAEYVYFMIPNGIKFL